MNSRFTLAIARMHRRAALWHAHRLLCRDDDEFRARWHVIADDVAARLRAEFPTL